MTRRRGHTAPTPYRRGLPARATTRRLARATTTLLFVIAGCSDSDEGACVREEDASVCADRDGGSVTIQAEGLRPGSELRLTTSELGTQRYPVGDDGKPTGGIGFFGPDIPGGFRVEVAATTADGTTLAGELEMST